jgi:hypothetical protein
MAADQHKGTFNRNVRPCIQGHQVKRHLTNSFMKIRAGRRGNHRYRESHGWSERPNRHVSVGVGADCRMRSEHAGLRLAWSVGLG